MHGHRIRFAAAVAAVVVTVAMVAPTVASARQRVPRVAATTSYQIQSKSWASGGYKWSFSVYKSGSGISLIVRAFKRASTGNRPQQSLQWTFGGLQASDASFAADLTPTSLDTGTDMGPYGSINMSLKKPSKLKKTSYRCPKNGNLLYTRSTRSGSFGGSFTFNKSASGFKTDVTKSSVGVTVTKFVNTNEPCPGGGGGGGGGGSCAVGSSFSASQSSTGRYVSASRRGKTASLGVSASQYDSTNLVSAYQSISASVPAAAVAIGAKAVKLNGGALAPFGTGVLKFTKVTSTTTTKPHCKTTNVTDQYGSGSLTAKFATGNVVLNAFDSAGASIVKKI